MCQNQSPTTRRIYNAKRKLKPFPDSAFFVQELSNSSNDMINMSTIALFDVLLFFTLMSDFRFQLSGR